MSLFRKGNGRVSKSAVGGASISVGAAVIALATPFIASWEGKRNYAYQDVVGVWTICYGSTAGVKRGDYKTDAECTALLQREVGEFYGRIDPCLNDSVPVSVQASALELAYNVGTNAACNSTMFRLANEGRYTAACAELDRWVRAGGQVVRGLVNRRNASYEMCTKDI